MDDTPEMLRPINFGDAAPGRGYTILDSDGYRILVINAMGNIHIEPVLDSPYPFIDKVLLQEAGKYDISILDFHAEATGEKMAIGYAYDGKINVIFGTHTHVQTADEQILQGGTAYISDVGMTGPHNGVIGMDRGAVVNKFVRCVPQKFKPAEGCGKLHAVFIEADTETGRAQTIKRISIAL